MGEAAGSAAGGASLVSLGLGAFGTIMKGQGVKAADDFKAAQAEQAAEFGRLQATLTDTTMRERLNTVIGNIEAVRAAGHVDPTSPSVGAVEDWQTKISDRQRIAQDVTLRSQAASDDAAAAYLRKAGDFAVTQSYLQAGTDIAGGYAKYQLAQQKTA